MLHKGLIRPRGRDPLTAASTHNSCLPFLCVCSWGRVQHLLGRPPWLVPGRLQPQRLRGLPTQPRGLGGLGGTAAQVPALRRSGQRHADQHGPAAAGWAAAKGGHGDGAANGGGVPAPATCMGGNTAWCQHTHWHSVESAPVWQRTGLWWELRIYSQPSLVDKRR